MATAAASRYARAVFDLATAEGRLDEWHRHLAAINELLADPQVSEVLSNPTIPAARRLELISAPKFLDPEATNLVRMLIESGRLDQVSGIVEEFERLADEAAGRVQVMVTTAVELTPEERDQIAGELARRLSEEVHVHTVVDPAIIGGLRLQYGDHLVDATVANRLDQLRRRLAGAS